MAMLPSSYKVLPRNGYPPITHDEVYKEIFEQAERVGSSSQSTQIRNFISRNAESVIHAIDKVFDVLLDKKYEKIQDTIYQHCHRKCY